MTSCAPGLLPGAGLGWAVAPGLKQNKGKDCRDTVLTPTEHTDVESADLTVT